MNETNNDNLVWETVFTQTAEAFETLRKALEYIGNANIADHMHGTVRVLASILQVQRFEIAVLSFDNCRAHLNAALALFEQLVSSSGSDAQDPKARFYSVLNRLGPTSRLLPGHSIEVQSAEQAAFRFSLSLLILDDIIASTILLEPPRLSEYHLPLLSNIDGPSPLDISAVLGCQNTILLHLSAISALSAWKHAHTLAGTLDVIALVHRATAIKNPLESHLDTLSTTPVTLPARRHTLLDQTCALSWSNQRLFVTRIWGHAALLYLSLVVSGWQPASAEVHRHVDSILDLLDEQTYPPALLRSVAWPFCVAGCLATGGQEGRFRGHVDALGNRSVFGALNKALGIMEGVWKRREEGRGERGRELADFFRDEGELVLLV